MPRWRPGAMAAAIIVGALGLAGAAGGIGFAIGHETKPEEPVATTISAAAPRGHFGKGLPAHEFGNPAVGARLFVSKGCSDCHSYGGKGGTDAPPLDFMAGHLSAREVANMSGQIWNHLPAMLHHFKEEGLPVPTFTGHQMADLVAYLHSRAGQKPATAASGETAMGGMKMGPVKPGNPARGKIVFVQSGCGGCHTFATAGTTGTVGPDLDSALTGQTAAEIEKSILDPNKVVAKGYKPNVMPASYGRTLSKQELADLVAFMLAAR